MTEYPEYLLYLEQAKRAEIAERLRLDGFAVEFDKHIGEVTFDLFAKDASKMVVYEFKSVGSRRRSREEFMLLQKAAQGHGYDLRVVVVNPPPRVNVEVEHLKQQLLDYAINKHFPEELDSLSSHTYIEDLSEIDVSDIRVTDDGVAVEGSGTVDVRLEFGGGDSRDGASMSDAYPFHFAAKLARDGKLTSVAEFSVNTASFYE